MAHPNATSMEDTYPLRAAAQLTGLSPDVLRAWERRHGVVTPVRTPGGTRRYRASDLERLRLLKAAVDAGHRIGQLAKLDLEELRATTAGHATPPDRFADIISAVDELDDATAQRLLAVQLSTLGPSQFASQVALPLIREIGSRWADGKMGIASEHLATNILRSQLGAALQPTANSLRGSRIVFATPSGERHELGLLMAALTALGAGGNPLYLGLEVPVEDLLAAVDRTGARALALSLVTIPVEPATRTIAALRGGLRPEIAVWVGGHGAARIPMPEHVDHIDTLERLEQRVSLLEFDGMGHGS